MKLLFTITALLVLPATAWADSDGYYCIGKGFIAFELSQASPRRHLLHIVRVAHATGITRLPPIPLEDFQVHGMTCRENGIDVQGWSTRYSVTFAGAGTPTVTSSPIPFDPKNAPPQLNLGMLARPTVTDIPSDGATGEFQLVITAFSRPRVGGIEHYTSAFVFQRGDPAAPLRRQVDAFETLYVGVRLETGG